MLILENLSLQSAKKSFLNSTQKYLKIAISKSFSRQMDIWLPPNNQPKSRARHWSSGLSLSRCRSSSMRSTVFRCSRSTRSGSTLRSWVWSEGKLSSRKEILLTTGKCWPITIRSTASSLQISARNLDILPTPSHLPNSKSFPFPPSSVKPLLCSPPRSHEAEARLHRTQDAKSHL